MLKKIRLQLILILILFAGSILLLIVLNSLENSERQKSYNRLQEVHKETILKLEYGINVYATIVSSIRSYIQNGKDFPTEDQLQSYLFDLLKDLDFKDSIVVSWVDTNQVFRYCVTPYKTDPFFLNGKNVAELRPAFEIDKLNKLMYEDRISLFSPINLYEGWAAFPFNFSARNNKGQVLGYIAPVLNVKYLLDQPYRNANDTNFLHHFVVQDTIDLTRETVFDGTTVYNKKSDPAYYKLFKREKKDFIYSQLYFYDLKIKVGTAYKNDPGSDHAYAFVIYLWYGLLIVFTVITIGQFYKIIKVNQQLEDLHKEIEIKNVKLNSNIAHIRMLIKEIHHRVKNNMQIISSLVNLQSEEYRDQKIKSVLTVTKNRIQSLALVHQKLYGTENFSTVNFKEYLEQLIGNISSAYANGQNNVSVSVDVPDNYFKLDTIIPLGLILNELLTNSYKYAFENTRNGQIIIKVSEADPSGKDYIMHYSDSGPGISEEKIQNCETLGLQLIFMLSEQMDGRAEYSRAVESSFKIHFTD